MHVISLKALCQKSEEEWTAPPQLVVLPGNIHFEEQEVGLFRGHSNHKIHLELRNFATYNPHPWDSPSLATSV